MKKVAYSSEVKRLKNVIESDRLNFTADSLGIISYDLQLVLQNYFTLNGKPKVKIVAENGQYTVTVEVTADTIKPFGLVP